MTGTEQEPIPVRAQPLKETLDANKMPPKHLPIGEIKGIMFDSVAWDTAGAAVDLSFGCMFENEVPGSIIKER